MVAFGEPVGFGDDCWRTGDEVNDAIGWAARNSAKPARSGPESWVIQATPKWSRSHIDDDPGEVVESLMSEFADALDVTPPARIGSTAHLWRFARVPAGGAGPFFDGDRRLGLCGDWLIGPRVESAWLCGTRLADRVASAGR
jgi:predicted NAD/FAD-dependent oxidoreductase